MAKFIFISPYLKGGKDAAKLSHRTRYIATREGVELLQGDNALTERENFLDYVAHRPGVKRDGEHGLWDANGKVKNLSAAVREVAEHEGVVWTPVVSMRRADAERLGYTDVENWRAVVNASINEIAEGYKIAPNHLRWYAALHEKEKHVHIHMVIFSTDPKEGYLTRQGIRTVKSAFARHIFEQDLICTYQRQTEYRDTLQQEAAEKMSQLVERMSGEAIHSEKLELLTGELAERLRNVEGRKVYGYLPPQVKQLVDAIVDELARDERVAEAYSLWQEMRDEVCRIYSSKPPERQPLSRQKEFKPVRNMVIREALKLAEQPAAFDGELEMRQSSDAQYVYEQTQEDGQRVAVGSAVLRMLHHMSRIFHDNAVAADSTYLGMQIDRKRRQELRDKRIAMGHKPDDHEEQVQHAMR